ncbi:MAG: sulfite exporter TauE/SafE family protein [Ruminococcaceae bacterium]|nr:sulfite exporter TauE/SafE family protein [Oscillospiraceae bacterium]
MNIIVGFLTGVVASMGLGGGFVLMIWLTMFSDVGQKEAQGINLLFFLPIALVSLVLHIKGGLIDKSLLKKYLLGGVLGAVIGALAMQVVASELLRKLFAAFLIVFGIRELLTSDKKDEPQNEKGTTKPDIGT